MRKLKQEEVRERLESYSHSDTGVTDELYDFGKMLVAEVIDRNNRLETKAAAIAAYSIGIITLLASTYGSWSKVVLSIGLPIPVFGAIAALVATICAVRGLTLRGYKGISQNEWINAECLKNRDMLRRYHILTMWVVLDSHENASEIKAKRIGNAQWALFFAVALLVLSLVDSVFRLLVRA
jgi:hypothetical protein